MTNDKRPVWRTLEKGAVSIQSVGTKYIVLAYTFSREATVKVTNYE